MSTAPIVLALRQRRLALGLTQGEVAFRLHISRRALVAWESGARSPDARMVEAYARVLSATLCLDPPLPDSALLDDEIMVERGCAGTVPWRQLTQSQRVEVYRRLEVNGWSQARIMRHLRISGSTMAAVLKNQQHNDQAGVAA